MSRANSASNSREYYRGHPDVVRIGSSSLSYHVYIKSMLAKDNPVRVKLNEYDHIEALKRRLSRKIGIPISCQNFLFKGRILKSGNAKENGLYPGCIVTLCPVVETGLMDNPHGGPTAPLLPAQPQHLKSYSLKSPSIQVSKGKNSSVNNKNNNSKSNRINIILNKGGSMECQRVLVNSVGGSVNVDSKANINQSVAGQDLSKSLLLEVENRPSASNISTVKESQSLVSVASELEKNQNGGRYISTSISSHVEGEAVGITEGVQGVTITAINMDNNLQDEKLEQNTRKKMANLRQKMIEMKRARAQRADNKISCK